MHTLLFLDYLSITELQVRSINRNEWHRKFNHTNNYIVLYHICKELLELSNTELFFSLLSDVK